MLALRVLVGICAFIKLQPGGTKKRAGRRATRSRFWRVLPLIMSIS